MEEHYAIRNGVHISFRKRIKSYKKHKKPIIVIDESGFSHDMPQTHRSTLHGKHYGRVCGRTNSALLKRHFDCYVDVFKAWVTQELLPKIPKISMIVMVFPSVQISRIPSLLLVIPWTIDLSRSQFH